MRCKRAQHGSRRDPEAGSYAEVATAESIHSNFLPVAAHIKEQPARTVRNARAIVE